MTSCPTFPPGQGTPVQRPACKCRCSFCDASKPSAVPQKSTHPGSAALVHLGASCCAGKSPWYLSFSSCASVQAAGCPIGRSCMLTFAAPACVAPSERPPPLKAGPRSVVHFQGLPSGSSSFGNDLGEFREEVLWKRLREPLLQSSGGPVSGALGGFSPDAPLYFS